jgi:hypothetical protein
MKDKNFMKTSIGAMHNSFYWKNDLHETDAMQSATSRLKQILDAKYNKADLKMICQESKHLSHTEQQQLLAVLQQHEELFDGTLGCWKGQPYTIELKQDAKPYHAKAFPVPKIHEATFKMELSQLCEIGVLKKINHSEWAVPTFIIPKKDGSV